MAKISIIIPNWNGADKLAKHLPEVLKVARQDKIEEVIVADDASTDDSLTILKEQFPEVRVIESKLSKNVGFGSNVNRGVVASTGDYVVLLNSDAHLDKEYFKFALPHFEDKKVFSVGGKVDGLWSIGSFKDGFFWHGEAKNGDSSKSHQSLWSSGGSSIFRKSIWDELGGLDPLYDPFYEEDVDLGYRATKRGYINIWEPKSIVEHYKEPGVIASNFSKSLVSKTAQRNHLIFIWKNITSQNLIIEHRKTLMTMLITKPGYWSIFWSAFTRWGEIMKKRAIEKKESKLSDEEIFAIFAQN